MPDKLTESRQFGALIPPALPKQPDDQQGKVDLPIFLTVRAVHPLKSNERDETRRPVARCLANHGAGSYEGSKRCSPPVQNRSFPDHRSILKRALTASNSHRLRYALATVRAETRRAGWLAKICNSRSPSRSFSSSSTVIWRHSMHKIEVRQKVGDRMMRGNGFQTILFSVGCLAARSSG